MYFFKGIVLLIVEGPIVHYIHSRSLLSDGYIVVLLAIIPDLLSFYNICPLYGLSKIHRTTDAGMGSNF